MCTLTIVPKSDGFLLTANRDEAKSRKAAIFPSYQTIKGQNVLFPQDGDAHGSWIAMNDKRVVTLLNGAYRVYDHQPPYRKSRGLVLLDTFHYSKLEKFTEEYNFEGIAPFTIVCLEHQPELSVEVLRWDGENTTLEKHDPKESHIFSSIPLYSEAIRAKRKQLFEKFIKNADNHERKEMVHFHQFGGDENIPIKIDDSHFVRTVSITSVEKSDNQLSMQYHDLKTNKVQNEIYQKH